VEDRTKIPEPTQMFQGIIEEESLLDLQISEEIVEKKLKELKLDKCPGLDGIHSKMLFELRKEISIPLAGLFSQSLETGVVPTDWKDAGVIPLFKKGKKFDVQNIDL
jgi:hypothetical protein